MRNRCRLLGDFPHAEISLSNIVLPLYLPLALSCLPNVLSSPVGFIWTLPPATRSCSAPSSQTLPRADVHLFLPAAK